MERMNDGNVLQDLSDGTSCLLLLDCDNRSDLCGNGQGISTLDCLCIGICDDGFCNRIDDQIRIVRDLGNISKGKGRETWTY